MTFTTIPDTSHTNNVDLHQDTSDKQISQRQDVARVFAALV
jgi:hypothetical protein